MALVAILQAAPKAMMTVLVEKKMTKEARDTLKEMHAGADRIKEARVQTLKSEFDMMYMKETESINDFVMKLITIVNKICVIGDKMDECTIVKKFLYVVPDKFLQIVSIIEKFCDIRAMTVMEVVGHLKTYEECMKGRQCDEEGEHILLTRAEWESKAKKQGANNSGKKNHKFDKEKVHRYNCQDYVHFAFDCHKPRKEKAETHLIEADAEDEPALLWVVVLVFLHAS